MPQQPDQPRHATHLRPGIRLSRRDAIRRMAGAGAGLLFLPGAGSILSACGDRSVQDGSATGSTTSLSAPDGTVGGTTLADAVEITDVDEILIGVVAPFSGAFTFIGDVTRRALLAAVAEINANGGVGGRKVRTIEVDAPGEELTAATEPAYSQLASTQNLSGVLWCTAIGLRPLAEQIKRDNMPVISVFEDLSVSGNLWPSPDAPRSVFQFLLSVDAALDQLSGYVTDDRGYADTVLVRDVLLTSPYAQDVERIYAEIPDRFGLATYPEIGYSLGQKDFGGLVSQLRETNAQSVIIAGGPEETALIAQEMDAQGLGYVDTPTAKDPASFAPQLFGTPANMGEPVWVDLAGDAAKTGSITAWTLGGVLNAPNVPIVEMGKKHTDGPNFIAGENEPADGLWTLLAGIREAGSATDRQKVVEAIESLESIQFATRVPFSFTADRHQRNRPEDLCLITLERSTAIDTDPPYELGREWEENLVDRDDAPVHLVRPTLEANRTAAPELMDEILAGGYGCQCTKTPADASGTEVELTTACRIH